MTVVESFKSTYVLPWIDVSSSSSLGRSLAIGYGTPSAGYYVLPTCSDH
jgi:hypothetical protein